MTYKYSPCEGPGGSKEITMHLYIRGTMHRVVFSTSRFEKTIDKIDEDIEGGASFKDICKKYASNIISVGTPVVAQPAATKADKKTIVKQIIEANPHYTLGEVSKAASKEGGFSYANARYLANTLMEAAK